jgi:hypothetical protein
MNGTRGSTLPNPSLDLSNRSRGLHKTLGTIGTPHEESIAKFNPTKTCPNKRNRRNPAKSTSNPRTRKTPKSSAFYARIWEGNHSPKNHEGFPQISPMKSPRARSRKHPKRINKRGLQNHHQEQPGTTHPNLEEPRRIIYTCHKGSYKV